MPSLDLKTKSLKFHAPDERAIAEALTLTEVMEQHCPEVKGVAVLTTDGLKKLLAHIVKSRMPKPKVAETQKA